MTTKNSLLFAVICFITPLFLSAQNIIFADDFNNGQFMPEWNVQPNISGDFGIISVANNVGFENTPGVQIGKFSDDGGFTTNALDLHLDLLGYTEVELIFFIFDNDDNTHVQDGLFFSDNGGNSFVKVMDFEPDAWCNQYGNFPPIQVHKLAAENGLMLNDDFVIRFQQYDDGDFGFGYIGPDGFFLDDVIVYEPALEYFPISANNPFGENFETGQLDNMWAWRFPDLTSILADIPTRPSNIVYPFINEGWESSYGLAMGKTCDDGFSTNALDLHLDLSEVSEAELYFLIRDNDDETHIDDGIYFSDDGGLSFEKVLDFEPSDWCDQYGNLPPIQIHKIAEEYGLTLSSNFIIRFQQHDDGDFGFGYIGPDGIFLDEVYVYEPDLVYYPVTLDEPFKDGFETGAFGNMWAWRFPGQTSTLAQIPARPSSVVAVFNGNGFESEFGVGIGKSCDDGFATNALDLHLDLSASSTAMLSFLMQDISDETHVDDGLYFSDDGGGSFVKVFDFLHTDWCDAYNQLPPIPIHELAAEHELTLTDQFIIRFQQHDDGDFGFGYIGPDGLLIDDVCVYIPETAYFPLTNSNPFFEDFETGSLRNMWTWPFADETTTLTSPSTTPSTVGGVFNNIGFNSAFGAALGKACDDGFSAAALDLHLDLSQATNVQLTYQLFNNDDETHDDDGIYFSNDGGTNFEKVVDYDLDNVPTNFYQQFSHDVSALAAAAGLNLTSQFVIRFQQYDDGDFGFGYIGPDGIYLDDINITGDMSSAVHTPKLTVANCYPNPAKEELFVDLGHDFTSSNTTYKLYDWTGALLQSGALEHQLSSISLAGLPQGCLLLKIERDGQEREYLRFMHF